MKIIKLKFNKDQIYINSDSIGKYIITFLDFKLTNYIKYFTNFVDLGEYIIDSKGYNVIPYKQYNNFSGNNMLDNNDDYFIFKFPDDYPEEDLFYFCLKYEGEIIDV